MYIRQKYKLLHERLSEKRKFIQVILGPRQIGKTTLINQVLKKFSISNHYASADDFGFTENTWIEVQWNIARQKSANNDYVLVLDEVQKISQWPTIVKKLWDEDTINEAPLKVVLLGSSSLLMQKGLQESMAGRFEIIHLSHWSFNEMRDAFDWDLQKYIYFGGYPGSADIIDDETRWMRYILDSLVETTISRDILLLNPVYKPALLRQLFDIGCAYSGQILSFNKMLGQLHDAGNTTTLSHYLHLLSGAGMLTGLQKYTKQSHARKASSSPKLQVLNNSLLSTHIGYYFNTAYGNHDIWGRLVESAVGAHLVNSTLGTKWKVYYWRDNNLEVDFVLENGNDIVAVEVKSNRRQTSLVGIEAFKKIFRNAKPLLIGGSGIELEEFLSAPIEFWL